MSNYLVFCDEWPQDADVRETLLRFKIPEECKRKHDPVQYIFG